MSNEACPLPLRTPGAEASAIELLQAEFAANPDLRSSSSDSRDSAYLQTIACSECFYLIAVQNSQLVFRTAEPDAA